jgi:hypothetical protein
MTTQARAKAHNTQDPASFFEAKREAREHFLAENGCDPLSMVPVSGDCSCRRFFRVRYGDSTTIFMESLPDDDPNATPGHKFGDFLRIARHLRENGISVPAILAEDLDNAQLLVEDFGEMTFKRALETGATDSEALYTLGVDTLLALGRKVDAGAVDLPDYFDSHIHDGRKALVNWYLPATQGRLPDSWLVNDYVHVWDRIISDLPRPHTGFVHGDFHLQNLMWREEKQGLSQCGILDFQGAMHGPLAYDLANLLEDARVHVSRDLRARMLAHYCADMSQSEAENFRQWYRVLGTQFHCRVAGQFIRLAVEHGKTRYLDFLPIVESYLREALDNPLLGPLAEWFDKQGITLDSGGDISRERYIWLGGSLR